MADDTLVDRSASAARDRTLDLRREIKRCPECGQQFSPDGMFCPFDGSKLEGSLWDPSGDPLLGRTIDGRYEVVGVEGEGGMGTVYEVRHKTLGRTFAMKVLRRDVARDPELSARFLLEARATAAIKHPHIVAITDFGRLEDETPYFVMELLVGQTLAHVLKMGPLPTSRAAKIATQVASALGAAHEAGVVHRDLKPENVFLVKKESGEDDVRVVDFGAAKVVGAGRLTKTGIVFGTPHYMSPEQASGQPVDHRADIYALGVIMYEMFTGRVPFEADTYMGVLTQHMFAEPMPPSKLVPDARLGALEEVTLCALEKKPEQRYQTMQELAGDIQKVVHITDEGTVEVAPKLDARPRRSRVPLLAPTPPAFAPTPVMPSSRDGSRPSSRPMLVLSAVSLAVIAVVFLMLRRHPVDSEASPTASVSASIAATIVAPPVSAVPRPAASPPPPPTASVWVTSTPPAEVWSGGAQVGTTPMSLTVPASATPVKYLLKAPGYLDRELMVGPTTGPQLHSSLQRRAVPTAPTVSHTTPAPPAPNRPAGGEIVDPWATK